MTGKSFIKTVLINKFLVDNIQFPVHHEKLVKTNKNRSIIAKKINLIFCWKSFTVFSWSCRDTVVHQGLSNITGVISKLIGVKFKNSPVGINDSVFSLGCTRLWNIVGEIKNLNTFHRGMICEPNIHRETFRGGFS